MLVRMGDGPAPAAAGERSWPAEKWGPFARSRITRTSLSAAAHSHASLSSSRNCWFWALRRSGRLRVIVATPSADSREIYSATMPLHFSTSSASCDQHESLHAPESLYSRDIRQQSRTTSNTIMFCICKILTLADAFAASGVRVTGSIAGACCDKKESQHAPASFWRDQRTTNGCPLVVVT